MSLIAFNFSFGCEHFLTVTVLSKVLVPVVVTTFWVLPIRTISDQHLFILWFFNWYLIVLTNQYANMPKCKCAIVALSFLRYIGRRSRSVFRVLNAFSISLIVL